MSLRSTYWWVALSAFGVFLVWLAALFVAGRPLRQAVKERRAQLLAGAKTPEERKAILKREQDRAIVAVATRVFDENFYPQLDQRVRDEIEQARVSDSERVDRWYRAIAERMTRDPHVYGRRKVIPVQEWESLWEESARN